MKKKTFIKRIANEIDGILLLAGMAFICAGAICVSVPFGLLVIGACLIVLALIVAAKQAKGE